MSEFACTLRFHSPKAYEYVRRTFDNALPHSTTIRSWYSSIDAKPGHLKRMATTKKYDVCISMDEVAIRQQVQYIAAEDRHTGYVTYGFDGTGQKPHATKALVFMVQGLTEPFKIAVSYFFINSLKSHQKAMLLMEVVDMVFDTEMNVRCITSDGDPNNLASFTFLGADFQSFEPFIVSPKAPAQKIYITLDACHMLKLARNLIGNYGTIWNGKGEPIEWSYFVKLVEYQKDTELQNQIGAVKMRRKHLEFDKCKMSVHIAAETMSRSVAKAFKHLKTMKPNEFESVDSTEEYVVNINDAFDILNSSDQNAKGFKLPITIENIDAVKKFAKDFSSYLQGFTVKYRNKIVNVLRSPLKTGFLGLICTLNNSINLYTDLVESGITSKLCTLFESQDMLENHFGRVRQLGGFNRNLNTTDFESAMRKLLFDNEVQTTKYSNVCTHDIPLLTVSSYKNKAAIAPQQSLQNPHEICRSNQPNNKENIDTMVAYRAACLEKLVVSKIDCEECKRGCFIGEKLNDTFVEMVKEHEGLNLPCIDTIELLNLADNYVHCCVENKEHFELIVKDIFDQIIIENVYKDSSVCHDGIHKENFIKNMIKFYLRARFTAITSDKTESLHKEYWGNKSAKNKQFAGQ